MSYAEADLDQDYAAQAADAENAIANIAAQASSLEIQGAHDADIEHDDNASVNSADLAAFGNDDMDDAEMMKMLNGDGDDDLLKDLMGEDDDMDFNMDDPDALEKLMNPKKKEAPKAAPKAAPARPKSVAKPTPTPTPATKPTAQSPSQTATPPAQADQNEIKAAPTPPAKLNTADKALMKQREEEYTKVINMVNENIVELKAYVTSLLRQKKQTEAATFLPLVKQAESFFQLLSAAKKSNQEVPSYTFTAVSLEEEKKNNSIEMDDVHITVVNIVGVKSTSKYSLNVKLIVGKEQSQSTKQVKGKDVLEFNQPLQFTLHPSNIRSSQNGLKLCKLAKCSVELHSHGMLWGSNVIGTGDVKCSPMLTKGQSVQTIKLRDEDNNIVGQLEIKLDLHKPFEHAEFTKKVINIVKPVPKHEPAPVSAPPTKTTVATPTTTKQTTTTPTTAAPAKPAGPNLADMDPENMSVTQICTASGWSLGVKQFNVASELPPFVSFDNITGELESLEGMIKSGAYKRRLDAMSAKLMLGELESRKYVLETQVERGVMSLDDYVNGCKQFLPSEVKLETELMKVAKWYKSKKLDDEARYYFELALWVKKRHVTLANEIKNAEENAEDLEDE